MTEAREELVHHRALVFAITVDDRPLRSITNRLELERVHVHVWQPVGLTLFGLGQKVQLTIHSWPERGLVSVDLLGDADSIDRASALIEGELGGIQIEGETFARSF